MILLMGVGTGGVGAVSLAQYLHPNHLNYNSRLYKHLPHHSHHRSHTQSGLPIVSQYISTKLFPGFFLFWSTSPFSSYKSHTQNIPLAESVWNAQGKHTGVMIELSSPAKSSQNGISSWLLPFLSPLSSPP